MISTTIENWNDVIEFKVLGCAAIGAHRTNPFSSLTRGELLAVSSEFGRFIINMGLASWKNFKHFIAVKTPHFARCFSNSLTGFFRVPIPRSIFISDAFSFSAFGNFMLRFLSMGTAPKWIVFTTIERTDAGIGTEASLTFTDAPCLAEKLFTAGFAFKNLPWFVFHLLHHTPPSDNGVNSKNNSTLRLYMKKVKGKMESTLSQARRETSLKVQRLGDEAKGYAHASNFPQECPTRKG